MGWRWGLLGFVVLVGCGASSTAAPSAPGTLQSSDTATAVRAAASDPPERFCAQALAALNDGGPVDAGSIVAALAGVDVDELDEARRYEFAAAVERVDRSLDDRSGSWTTGPISDLVNDVCATELASYHEVREPTTTIAATSASTTAWSSIPLSADADPTAVEERLAGRGFIATSMAGRALVTGTEIRVTFLPDEPTLTVYAGCNHLSGPFEIIDGQLRILGIGSTAIGCQLDLQDQDAVITELLMSSPSIELDSDTVTLTGPSGAMELVDARLVHPDRPLAGTVWQVDSLLDRVAAMTVPGLSANTITFDDTTVTVSSPCGRAHADAVVDASRVTVAEPSVEPVACTAAQQEVFGRIVRTVVGISEATVHERNLDLRNDNGLGLGLVAS